MLENNKQWYVVHARSGCEKKVQQALIRHINEESNQRFGRVMVPEEEIEALPGKKQTRKSKVFPGYVLVEMEHCDETIRAVRNIPQVIGFIGGEQYNPTPISDAEADTIIADTEDRKASGRTRQRTFFEAGESVRVIDGPFSDFSGVVEAVDHAKLRLNVSVSIFGRSTPVELTFSQVEKT